MEEIYKTSKKYANISIQPLQKAPAAKPKLESTVLPQDGLSDREVMAEPTCYVKNKRRIAHVPRFPLPVLKKPFWPEPMETPHSSISEKKKPSNQFFECSTAKNPKHAIKLSNIDDSANKEEKKNDKKRTNEDLTECSVNKKLKKIETAHSSDSVNKEKEKNDKKRTNEDFTDYSVNKKLKIIETPRSSGSVNKEQEKNHKKRTNEDLTDYSVNKKLKKNETPRCIESVLSKYYVAVLARIKSLCYALDSKNIDPASVAALVMKKCYYSGMTTSQIDDAAAEMAITMTNIHPDYETLSTRIAIFHLHMQTKEKFSDVMEDIHKNDEFWNIGLSDDVYETIMKNKDRLNSAINYDNDYAFDYFGFRKLNQYYLTKFNNQTVERPQHLFMKVAVAIHRDDIDSAIETYNMLSQKVYMFSPVVMQLLPTAKEMCRPIISHYSVAMVDDTIDGIHSTSDRLLKLVLPYSSTAVHVHKIRAAGTCIKGSNEKSSGLPLTLKKYDALVPNNETPERPKSIRGLAVYCELWHADIMKVLDQIRKTAIADLKLKNSSPALWIPDEFMRRVLNDEMWSFMSPDHCPGLIEVYGEEFDNLYKEYELKSKSFVLKQIEAKKLWSQIIQSQIETGLPLLLFKDACNAKSNESHLGTIQCAGRSGDTVQFTAPDEVATCTTASIAVEIFYSTPENSFHFDKLMLISKKITYDLNKIIETNNDILDEEKKLELGLKQNQLTIGIGVQGLADLFIKMKYPYDSKEAIELNTKIHETIYYGALEASCELAAKYGPYKTYSNCPASKGLLQFDLWNVEPSNLWDWNSLKKKIAKHGLRNSLITITSNTEIESKIFGHFNSVEPLDTNIKRRFISFGEREPKEFLVVNPYLLKDLLDRNLWNENLISELVDNMGSIQELKNIPEDLKRLYRTKWEIDQKAFVRMAADRAPFIDQSQALYLYMAEANEEEISDMHISTWKLGLKTGVSQLRIKQTEEDLQD